MAQHVAGQVGRLQKSGRLDEQGAAELFSLMEKFAGYGFNKSHAAAYALIAFQTAYLKANYTVEFLAASMTLDLGNTDKLAEFRREAERLGITVEPPSVNRGGREFDVADGKIVEIWNSRETGGPEREQPRQPFPQRAGTGAAQWYPWSRTLPRASWPSAWPASS